MGLKIDAERGAEVDIADAFLSRAEGTIRAARGCRVRIGHPVHIDHQTHLDFELTASGKIEIAEGCYLGHLSIISAGSAVLIGQGSTFYKVILRAFGGKLIRIGRDCMIGGDVEINTSDFHSLIDLETKQVINRARDVAIGDHVWIANNCHLLKGTAIADGSTVGACSVVTGKIPPNCVAVGSPAKPIRFNVGWSRNSPDEC